MIPPTSISRLLETDFEELLIIADAILGKNYITQRELENYIGNPSKICFVARTRGEMSGFQQIQICHYNELMTLALSEKSWFNLQFSHNLPIGVLKTIAISTKFQKQGIGTILTKKSLEVLTKSTNNILSICWVLNGVVPYSRILIGCGLAELRKINSLWKKDSLAKKYDCTCCGKPPCLCNAIIYTSTHYS
ncbi:MAG: GNAT family N-acetyltransferase [Flavobacteriales bacterium]|nr:GNAT family N-acetyltransferase [Flavobacteriales bacterium]